MLSKKVLVAGGTGEVGAGLAACFYKKGYEVHIISRNQEKIDALRDTNSEYFFYCIDCADFAACTSLANKIGEVDIFISSLGGFVESKNIFENEAIFFESHFRSTLLAQYNLLKYFFPTSKNFIAINGEAGLEVMPNYGLVSVFDAAQIMLTKVVTAENPERKLSQLIICEKVSEQDLPIQFVFEAIEDLLRNYKKVRAIGVRANLLSFSD